MILQCEEGYYLADAEELDAYVNGNKALVTEAAGGGVALTVEYSLAVSSGLRGQVVSFHDDSDVTVSLFADGSATPKYTVSVPGGIKDSSGKYIAEYEIPDVAAGTYTMTVSKSKHVTREYTVTVGAENVTQDVEIWLLGDVNGDGTINVKDKKLIFNHLNDPSGALTGYALDVGDVNRDGTINVKDKKLIFNHLKGTSLWS